MSSYCRGSRIYQRREAGLSLVELMIALVLGLVLSAGVITLFIESKRDYQVQEAISEVQESGRFAAEFIAHDARMAGFSGCSNDMATANTVDNAPPSVSNFSWGIEGHEGDSGAHPAKFPNALDGTDAVVFHVTDMSSELVVTNHNASSAQINVVNDHAFKPGAIMMIVDANCSNRGIFVMTSPTNSGENADNVVHNTGKTFTYGSTSGVGNCTKTLKGDFDCDGGTEVNQAYTEGSSVFSIVSVGYYIQDPSENSALTSPTLYRINFSSEFTAGATDNLQPLVEGVKNMDVLYGVRDGEDLHFKTADDITADEWPMVSVIRLEIEAESLTEVEGQTLDRTFVRTIKLRNRI